MTNIRDEYNYGLTSECPDNVKVSWGARAISTKNGFSLVHDRQTWSGNDSEIAWFSKLLNAGPLEHAHLECKRIKNDSNIADYLNEKEFMKFWNISKTMRPEKFESWKDVWSGAPPCASPKIAEPSFVWNGAKREIKLLEDWYIQESSKEEPDPEDPPDACESGEDEDIDPEDACDQEFVKTKNGWTGCYLEDDCWICETCGHAHYIDDYGYSDDERSDCPDTPFLDSIRHIMSVGRPMLDYEASVFTLYSDESLIIKADTRASYGYVYLIAYPAQ